MSEYYITNNKDLQEIAKLALDRGVVSLDTEFIREKTYYPILSLVQIAINNQSFAIDCQAELDLKPIFDLVGNQNVKKILHSCSQDLQIFYQKSKDLPKFVRDVQLMANFCGFGFNVGYSTLVEELVGEKIDKKLQRSNWLKRPLDKKQIEYALLDVVYLEEIYAKLKEILRQKKREGWFLEEMKVINDYFAERDSESLFKNFSLSRGLEKNPLKIAQIHEMILWREKKAQEKDVPRQYFLNDKDVEKIVFFDDFNVDLTKKNILEVKNLLKNVEKSDIKLDFQTKRVIINEEQKKRFAKAKAVVAEVAKKQGLQEQFLIPSHLLKDIVVGRKKLRDYVVGWRYYLFGSRIEKLIS